MMRKSEMIRIVIAADLSTRPQFRGMGSDNPHLLEIANEWMHRRDGHMMRATVEDDSVIAEAVWRALRPQLRELLRPVCHQSLKDSHLDAMIDRVFPNDVRYERR